MVSAGTDSSKDLPPPELQAPVWLAADQGRQTDLWAECGGFHAVPADSSVFVPPVTVLHVPR